MSQAHKRNRSSKGDAIALDDEDSASEQPAKKNAKIIEEEDVIVIDDEESNDVQPVEIIQLRKEEVLRRVEKSKASKAEFDPIFKVAELEAKLRKSEESVQSAHMATRAANLRAESAENQLLKSEEIYQRVCRSARTSELRAEAAESRLDSKYGIIEDFDAEKKRADDLEKSVAEISSQLEEARRRAETAEAMNKNLMGENEELKSALADVESVLRKSIDDHSSCLSRIDERKVKLAQYERESQLLQSDPIAVQIPEVASAALDEEEEGEIPESDSFTAAAVADKAAVFDVASRGLEASNTTRAVINNKEYVAAPDKVNELHETGHPTNILQPCRPDSSGSTSFEIAREKLDSIIDNSEGSGFGKKVKQLLGKFPEWEHNSCEVCGILQLKYRCYHFFSKGHKEKVSALGVAVSSAALDYWVDKLKPKNKDQEASSSIDATTVTESDSSKNTNKSEPKQVPRLW